MPFSKNLCFLRVKRTKNRGGLTEKPPTAEFILCRRSARKAHSQRTDEGARNGAQLALRSLRPSNGAFSIGNETKVAALFKGLSLRRENILMAKFA